MTIYIDDAFIQAKVGRLDTRWCHMMTDSEDLEELHQMAEAIGLKREWFQTGGYNSVLPHYDVTPGVRQKALRKGAVAIGRFEIGRKCLRCAHCGKRRTEGHDPRECKERNGVRQ